MISATALYITLIRPLHHHHHHHHSPISNSIQHDRPNNHLRLHPRPILPYNSLQFYTLPTTPPNTHPLPHHPPDPPNPPLSPHQRIRPRQPAHTNLQPLPTGIPLRPRDPELQIPVSRVAVLRWDVVLCVFVAWYRYYGGEFGGVEVEFWVCGWVFGVEGFAKAAAGWR